MNRKELKQAARESLRESGGTPQKVSLIFLVCAVVLQGLKVVLAYLFENIQTGGNYLSDSIASGATRLVLSYGSSIVLQVLFVILWAGLVFVALELRSKKAVCAKDLLAGTRIWVKVIVLYVIMTIYTCLWTYLFSIPVSYILIVDTLMKNQTYPGQIAIMMLLVYIGLVMFLVSYRYRMSFFMLMDDPEISARQAIRRAGMICKGHRIKILLLDLSFVPWILLCVLTCGVLFVWKLPYMAATYGHAYDALMGDYAQRQQKYIAMREQMMKERFPDA